MSFPFNVYLAALVSASLTVVLALPWWKRYCERIGLVDDPGHRKIHDRPVPLAGGLAVMTGLLVPACLGSILLLLVPVSDAVDTLPSAAPGPAYLLRYGLGRRALQLGGIFLGALGMLVVGWLDDKHELRAGAKFAGQLVVALLVAACGVRITLFVPNLVFSYAITVFWILAVINAFNFMDNMNGLCAGLGAIGSWYFAAFAAAGGQYLVALIAFLACGALLGFLPYNFPRARVFLGDAGSHLVGYLLAVLAILPHFYTTRHPHRWAVLVPLFVLGVPLLDMARVVLHRWRIGQPFYVGDNNHLSHLLVRVGLSRVRAVMVIWFLAALVGAAAILV